MFNRIHQKLGTAGFIISIVALVAALGGGAYAASGGLNGKQRKEVQKIAQQEAKKVGGASTSTAGPAGPQGSAGPAGAKGDKGDAGGAGPAGPTGPAGATGATGAAGAAGKSPSVVALGPQIANCEGVGGVKVVGAGGEEAFACNGEGGEGGNRKTQTGLYEVLGASGVTIPAFEFSVTTISFPVEVKKPPTEVVAVKPSTESGGPSPEEKEKCPGENTSPKAAPGVLCLYTSEPAAQVSIEPLFSSISNVGVTVFLAEKAAQDFGSWAATEAE
jgi:hypothetical protein